MRNILSILFAAMLAVLLIAPPSLADEVEPPDNGTTVVDEPVEMVPGVPTDAEVDADTTEATPDPNAAEWERLAMRGGGCETRSRTGSMDYQPPGYDVRLSIKMVFRHCGIYDRFVRAVYSTKTLNAAAGCEYVKDNGYRFNIGAFGTWNPPVRSLGCATGPVGEVHKRVVEPPASGENIGHSNGDRCAYFYLSVYETNGTVERATSPRAACLS